MISNSTAPKSIKNIREFVENARRIPKGKHPGKDLGLDDGLDLLDGGYRLGQVVGEDGRGLVAGRPETPIPPAAFEGGDGRGVDAGALAADIGGVYSSRTRPSSTPWAAITASPPAETTRWHNPTGGKC